MAAKPKEPEVMSSELAPLERHELQPATLENFAISKIDPAELEEVFAANFEGENLTPFDLTQIRVGRGGSTLWEVQGAEDGVKEVTGVILYFRRARAYWALPYGEGDVAPPDCSSQDAVHGNGAFGPGSAGNPSGMCVTCPMSKFATATRDGKRMRGQACAQNRFLFCALPNTVMPVAVKLPPTSLQSARKFFTIELMDARLKYWACVVSMTLKQETKGGFKVAVAKLRAVARLTPEALSVIEGMRAALMPVLTTVKVEVEREGGSTDEGD